MTMMDWLASHCLKRKLPFLKETDVVYKEVGGAIQQYKDVQVAALSCAAERRIEQGGVVADHALAELETAVARAQAALQAAQKPYRQRHAPAFYNSLANDD